MIPRTLASPFALVVLAATVGVPWGCRKSGERTREGTRAVPVSQPPARPAAAGAAQAARVKTTPCYNYGTPLDKPHQCKFNTPSCTTPDGCITYCGSCSYNICTAPEGGPRKRFFPTPCGPTSPFFGQIKRDAELQSCLAKVFGQKAVDDWVAGKIIVWPAAAVTPRDNQVSKQFATCYDGYYKRFCAKLGARARATTYKSLCDKHL